MVYSEHWAQQAQHYLATAREVRNHNRSLTRWTRQATKREAMIPVYVDLARQCNHKSLYWRRLGE